MTDSSLRMIEIDDLSDSRIAPYHNLRERTLRGESVFIAEGRLVTERLLVSQFPTESILVSREMLKTLPDTFLKSVGEIPVYVVPERLMLSQIAGFPFHQGMMALGKRIPLPNFYDAVINGVQTKRDRIIKTDENKNEVWIILPNATKPDNLGLVFRSAAALGAAGVVLGEECCDPFSRRALRVSMGGVLQVPVIQSVCLRREIEAVRQDELKNRPAKERITFLATILDPSAVTLSELKLTSRRRAVFFGNEYDGLDSAWLPLCDQAVTIPMAPGVDSLNLGVSVGIFLYELQQNKG